MFTISASNARVAINSLFAGKNAVLGRVDRYAEIIEFLTTENLVVNALSRIDHDMNVLLAANNGSYSAAGSPVANRVYSDQLRASLAADFGGQVPSQEQLTRQVHFRKLLIAMETVLGLQDHHRVFWGNVPGAMFTHMIRTMEVWKDSISLAHGEYTHRLQWLAIWKHFDLTADNFRDLYTNTTFLTVQSMMGLVQEPQSLWTFLVDCFPVIGANGAAAANAPADMAAGLNTHVVSDSFRSPTNLTKKLFSTEAQTPLITGYLRSSKAKLQLKMGQNGSYQEPLQPYRRRRLAAKFLPAGQTIPTNQNTIGFSRPNAALEATDVGKANPPVRIIRYDTNVVRLVPPGLMCYQDPPA